MPCQSDYMEPNARERESVKVLTLLTELGWDWKFDRLYGSPSTLDIDTRVLCEACKKLGDRVKDYSLELQIWWRDHQIADKKREEAEQAKAHKRALKAAALAKLTDEEIEALKGEL